MSKSFEDLPVLQVAEQLADDIWQHVSQWESFAQETVGKQLVRAVDSIGANIAEAFGRYHYGEKLQFLYYARGSLFESKYWINRTKQRNLLTLAQQEFALDRIGVLAKLLNGFVAHIKRQRSEDKKASHLLRDEIELYKVDGMNGDDLLFGQSDLDFLM